jgi:uncharacterized FAD-dependent dehydrogenase
MRVLIRQLLMPLDYEDKDIFPVAARKLGCKEHLISDLKIIRRSVDARARREAPVFSLTVEVELNAHISAQSPDIEIITEKKNSPAFHIPHSTLHFPLRPVVVGAGPAGLMAALSLAQAGASPILIERGAEATERTRQVSRFWKHGELNPESNVLFGEGGAGLFSDGKLTARSKDRPRVRRFFQTLADCGAPDSILIDAEPHLGSDALLRIVPNLKKRIEQFGGEIRLHSRLENIMLENGVLRGVVVNGEFIRTDVCILAVGHSARDVYDMLANAGVALEPKPFAVGVRLELPQHRIDQAQWGKWAGHPRLGAASFRLTHKKDEQFRACYTFCMCPGGRVIACASSPGELTTNGMSLSRRAEKFGNAAFLVPVGPDDFGECKNEELQGIGFQSRIERAAFIAGGSDYSLPACLLTDFLSGKTPKELPKELSCRRTRPADIHSILPAYVSENLIRAIPNMLKWLKGVQSEEAVVYAAETRSSSPVRILRDEKGRSVNTKGLFPAGEGAGYAGGIVSSAVDGLCAAEAVLVEAGS